MAYPLPPSALAGGGGGRPAGIPPNMSEQEALVVKYMQNAQETCVFKTILSGGAGFVLGGAFGLFMASMNYDTPLSPTATATTSLPLRTQLRIGFRDMGSRSFSSAKNFGLIGAMFAGTECCIEGFRGKHGWENSVAAGCVTGGILGAKAGPQAALLGCGGFAAFSAAIDAYLGMEGEEKSSDGL